MKNHYKFKNVTIILGISLIISCKPKSVIGTYEHTTGLTLHKLILKKDSTFQYNFEGDVMSTKSAGNYTILNNNIILNSYTKYKVNTIDVKESITNRHGIQIKDQYGYFSSDIYVTFENSNEQPIHADQNGFVPLDSINNPKSFKVHYMDQSYSYTIKQTSTTYFDITVYSDILLEYTYFKNALCKFKNEKLIMPYGLPLQKQ